MPFRVRAVVVIPTFNARDLLADALASIETQTVPAEIVVVDNASTDGTVEMLEARFPRVTVVRNPDEPRLRTGRQPRRGGREGGRRDRLVNNDAVCAPDFLERLLVPLADPTVGMVAGVLLQGSAPGLVDSAGIELDHDAAVVGHAVEPSGGRDRAGGGAGRPLRRRRRLPWSAFVELGGFDEQFFAYWEDVRPRAPLPAGRLGMRAGARRSSVPPATARRSVRRRRPRAGSRRTAAPTSSPSIASRAPASSATSRSPFSTGRVLVVHALFRRELAPFRARAAGRRDGLAVPALRAPLELATVGFREAIGRQASLLRLRFSGGLPEHFGEHAPSVSARSAVDDEERATSRH